MTPADEGDILLMKDGTFFYVDILKMGGYLGFNLDEATKRYFIPYCNRDIQLVFKGYTLDEIKEMDSLIDRMIDNPREEDNGI